MQCPCSVKHESTKKPGNNPICRPFRRPFLFLMHVFELKALSLPETKDRNMLALKSPTYIYFSLSILQLHPGLFYKRQIAVTGAFLCHWTELHGLRSCLPQSRCQSRNLRHCVSSMRPTDNRILLKCF